MRIVYCVLFLFMALVGQVYRGYLPENASSRISLDKGRELIQTFYPDGSTETECEYQDGRRDGIYREYYENGKLRVEMTFKNGRGHGAAHFYYDTGVLKMRIFYKRGKQEDHILKYDAEGKLISDQT